MYNNKENRDESCSCKKKLESLCEAGYYKPINVVYKTTIEIENISKIYIWLSTNQLKKLITAQKTTINIKADDKNYFQYKQATELQKLSHKLKNENKNYKLVLKVLKKKSS